MTEIIITGSSGQIGTNLALHLVNYGYKVIGVDCRPNPWITCFETFVCDLSRSDAQWPRRSPDLIVHLAANAKVHDSVTNPRIALENYQMGVNALEYAREKSIPIILGSSREVYGRQEMLPVTEDGILGLRPVSPYGSAKLALESLASAYNSSYGLPAISLRFSNVFGRYDTDIARLERVIPLFFQQILRGQSITVFNPKKTLDFTYIDDCVAGLSLAISAILQNKVYVGEYNISSGIAFSLQQLIDYIELLVGVDARVNKKATRTGEIDAYCACLTKSTSALGYFPRYHLLTGLQRAWSTHYSLVFSIRRKTFKPKDVRVLDAVRTR